MTAEQFGPIREALREGWHVRWSDDTVRHILEALDSAERCAAELERTVSDAGKTREALLRKAAEAAHIFEGDLNRLKDHIAAISYDLEAALAALETIREATNLALPSEQTGPEWERCVRVPVAQMMKIDAAVAGVLGEPAITNEPKPAIHAAPRAGEGRPG